MQIWSGTTKCPLGFMLLREQLVPHCLGAFVFNLEIASDGGCAALERMRLARPPIREHPEWAPRYRTETGFP